VNDSRYPAAWVLFVTCLSPNVERLTATLYDVGEAVARSYDSPLVKPDNVHVRFEMRDGYSGVSALGADLVFLDPPFFPKADHDWRGLHRTCSALDEASVPFVAWYPVYWPTKAKSFVARTSRWDWELRWAPFGKKPSQNLKGCGLAVSSRLAPLLHSAHSELEIIADRLKAEIHLRSPG